MTKNDLKNNQPLIILDLFGVLSLGSYKDTSQWIVKKYKLDYDDVYKIVYHKYFTAATLGKMTEAQSFDLTVKELGLHETGAELRRIHMSFQKLNRPIFRLAQSWQKKGAQVVVFSKNVPSQFNEVVKSFNLRRYFPIIINSYNLGLEKKSKEAMEYLLQRFKVKPEQTILIDDQTYNFIGAGKMGIKTVFYKSPAQIEWVINIWLKKL